mmetsp:Transcript_61908/g.110050  ORF Transcript_61908/g.110050 Transcript_61908/m.110050 type:complete len:300 (+) Transcript_61908:3-902(+)
MTEWWVSQKKHFCTYCKVYTGGHLWQIRKHEEGRMHLEKKELYLKNCRQREKDREREEEDVKKQLEAIEEAALAAMAGEASYPKAATATKGSAPKSVSTGISGDTFREQRAIEETVEAAKRQRLDEGGAASSTAPAAPVPAAEGSPWLICTDPNSGHVYYFNKATNVSAWEKPADLAVDLSKPPPPPSEKKPPPPPARKKKADDAAPGGWEEVKPQDSMFGHADEVRKALRGDDSDEEGMANPLGDLKTEVSGRKGTWAAEDLEMHEKEMVQKRSLAMGKATFGSVKKAGGIRKKREDD